MEQLNIAEILQNAPKGLDIGLYSPLIGECRFFQLINPDKICVTSIDGYNYHFHSDGTYFGKMGECLLYPTKQKTWENWQQHLFKEGCFITCDLSGTTLLYRGKDSAQDCENNSLGNLPISLYRFAKNEEISRFLSKVYDNGFKYIVKEKRIGVYESADTETSVTEKVKLTIKKGDSHEYKMTKGQFEAVRPILELITNNK